MNTLVLAFFYTTVIAMAAALVAGRQNDKRAHLRRRRRTIRIVSKISTNITIIAQYITTHK